MAERTSVMESMLGAKNKLPDEDRERVSNLLTTGMVQEVEIKQREAQEYINDIKGRLDGVIDSFQRETQDEPITLPGTAAVLPLGDYCKEISRALNAINEVADKHLKYTLTLFVDDFRRILAQNIDPEKGGKLEEDDSSRESNGLAASLPHPPAPPEETNDMMNSLARVEEAAGVIRKQQREALYHLTTVKNEKLKAQVAERPPRLSPPRRSRRMSINDEGAMSSRRGSLMTRSQAIEGVKNILLKPNVEAEVPIQEHKTMMSFLEFAQLEKSPSGTDTNKTSERDRVVSTFVKRKSQRSSKVEVNRK